MNDIGLTELLRESLDARIANLHVSMPGRIESFDAESWSASVKPLIPRGDYTEDDERVAESKPVIRDVPVFILGGGRFSVTAPPEVGDTVMLLFSEGALDRWFATGEEVDPGDDRMHSLSDAIAVCGISSAGAAALRNAPNDAIVVNVPEDRFIRLGSRDADRRFIDGDAFEAFIDNLAQAISTLIGAPDAAAAKAILLGVGKTWAGDYLLKKPRGE